MKLQDLPARRWLGKTVRQFEGVIDLQYLNSKKRTIVCIALLWGLCAFVGGFWYWIGYDLYRQHTYRVEQVITVEELVSHPLRYLNKRIIVKGYLTYDKTEFDALLFADKEAAMMENVGNAIAIAYPIDAKNACLDQYIQVQGIFQRLPENRIYSISWEKLGIGDVDYFGKIEDTLRLPLDGLVKTSCPSFLLPNYYGVGVQRDDDGNKYLMRIPEKQERQHSK